MFDASVARLAGAGAGIAITASVMMHRAFDRVAALAPIPMLSILDSLVTAAGEADIHRPGVIEDVPTAQGGRRHPSTVRKIVATSGRSDR